MNTRAAGRGTTTAGIAATTDAVTTVAAAGERGRQGTTRGVIYQPGSTLTKFGTFPENRTTSVSRSLTGSSTVPFHRGGRCFVRLPVSRSLTGSSTVPVHRKGGSRQRMSGPSTMSHPAMWTCPACGRPLTVALNPEGGEAGAHRPLEISRASAAAHACAPAARFPQFHNASSSSITGYEPASCQPWQPPVSAGAEDDEGVISQSEYTLTKPSSFQTIHVKRRPAPALGTGRSVLPPSGRRSSAFPFSRGIPPPAGVSRSLPREPGNRPPGSQGAPGPGGNLPRNPGARPFSTSTPRAAPCDTRAGRCNPRRGQPSGMHPAHTGHQSRPLLDTRAPPFRERPSGRLPDSWLLSPPAVRPRLNRGRRQPAARRDPLIRGRHGHSFAASRTDPARPVAGAAWQTRRPPPVGALHGSNRGLQGSLGHPRRRGSAVR